MFKTLPKKMKSVNDRAVRSSIFTVLIFIGVPLALIAILSPMIFIIGDKAMSSTYKLIWGALVFAFIVYFAVKQVHPKKQN
jgi:hypothetical protein